MLLFSWFHFHIKSSWFNHKLDSRAQTRLHRATNCYYYYYYLSIVSVSVASGAKGVCLFFLFRQTRVRIKIWWRKRCDAMKSPFKLHIVSPFWVRCPSPLTQHDFDVEYCVAQSGPLKTLFGGRRNEHPFWMTSVVTFYTWSLRRWWRYWYSPNAIYVFQRFPLAILLGWVIWNHLMVSVMLLFPMLQNDTMCIPCIDRTINFIWCFYGHRANILFGQMSNDGMCENKKIRFQ